MISAVRFRKARDFQLTFLEALTKRPSVGILVPLTDVGVSAAPVF